jgi:hypothetical protein
MVRAIWILLISASIVQAQEPESSMTVDLLPLGTGKGATAVYDGDPSTSFVIRVNREPVLLVDVGIGATRRCIELAGKLPRTIYVSHNHTDHAGELPVVVVVEATAGRPLTVVAAPKVLDTLITHRIDELYSTGKRAEELATWRMATEGEAVDVGHGLALTTVKSQHSEASFGFTLTYAGRQILGWTSDSGINEVLYEKLSAADHMVVDARTRGSKEHASFSEVEIFLSRHPGVDLWVTGYGTQVEAPTSLKALVAGTPVILWADSMDLQEEDQ